MLAVWLFSVLLCLASGLSYIAFVAIRYRLAIDPSTAQIAPLHGVGILPIIGGAISMFLFAIGGYGTGLSIRLQRAADRKQERL
jgi:Na+/H+ antiporter NhaA